jgi:hypothetical protein
MDENKEKGVTSTRLYSLPQSLHRPLAQTLAQPLHQPHCQSLYQPLHQPHCQSLRYLDLFSVILIPM